MNNLILPHKAKCLKSPRNSFKSTLDDGYRACIFHRWSNQLRKDLYHHGGLWSRSSRSENSRHASSCRGTNLPICRGTWRERFGVTNMKLFFFLELSTTKSFAISCDLLTPRTRKKNNTSSNTSLEETPWSPIWLSSRSNAQPKSTNSWNVQSKSSTLRCCNSQEPTFLHALTGKVHNRV